MQDRAEGLSESDLFFANLIIIAYALIPTG